MLQHHLCPSLFPVFCFCRVDLWNLDDDDIIFNWITWKTLKDSLQCQSEHRLSRVYTLHTISARIFQGGKKKLCNQPTQTTASWKDLEASFRMF